MGWFKKAFGVSTPKFIEQSGEHWDSWVPQVGGAILTALGQPWAGAALSGIGSGVANYQDTGSYGKAAVSGGLGALTSYGAGNLMKSFGTGWQNASGGLLSKLGGGVGSMFGLNGAAGSATATTPSNMAGTGATNISSASAPANTGLASQFGQSQATQFGTGLENVGLGSNLYSAPAAAPSLMDQFAATQTAPGVGGPALGSIGKTADQFASTLPQMGNGINATMGANGTGAATAQPGMMEKMFGTQGSLKRTAAGMAIPILGSAIGPQATTFNPYDSGLFNETLNRVRSGNMIELTPEQKQSITATYDEQYDTAVKNLDARYKSLNPGADIANNSQYRQDMQDLETDFATKKANALASAQMNLTQTQTEMLSQLASLDVYSLAQAAQISVQEANAFQEMLGQLGFMVAGGGNSSLGTGSLLTSGLSKMFS